LSSISNRLAGAAGATLLAAGILSVGACSSSATTAAPSGVATAGATVAPTAAPTAAATPRLSPTPEAAAATLSTPSADSRIAWTFATTGAIYGTATAADGAIYVGSDDTNLYSVDLAGHSLRWKFKTGAFVRSTPAVAGGLVYFTSDDGNIYAVQTADGSLAWKTDIGTDSAPRLQPDNSGIDWDFHQASPVVSGGVVYVGSADKNVYALDAASGSVKWTFKTAGMVRATPAVADGIVYIGSWVDGMRWYSNLYALDAATGKQNWVFEGAGDHPTAAFAGDMILIGGRQAFLYGLDVKTGKEKWSADFLSSWVESTCAISNGTAFVGSSALALVQAFDAATGDVRWRFTTAGFPWSSPAVSGGVVYIGTVASVGPTHDTGLVAIDEKTGNGLWWVGTSETTLDSSKATLAGVTAGPIVVDGTVYVGSLDGKLYAIKAN
jgi:outer membrane protein assembly factor BamB